MKNAIKISNHDKNAKENRTSEVLWPIILFLFASNLFGQTNFFLFVFLFLSLIVVFMNKTIKYKVTADCLLIVLFATSYFAIRSLYKPAGIISLVIYCFGPIIFFFMGSFIVKRRDGFLEKTLFAIVIGFFVQGFFNMANLFRLYGFNNPIHGTVPAMWSGIYLSTTLQATFFTLISSLFFYAFLLLSKGRNKILAFSIIFAAGFSSFSSVITGNRALLFILLIVFILAFLLEVILDKARRAMLIKILFLVSVLVSTAYLSYENNFLDIKEIILDSFLYTKMTTMNVAEDPRIMLWQSSLRQLFDFPFGGYEIELGTSSYAHNLWLDVLFATGLIPFFFLILYTFTAMGRLVKILKDRNVNIDFKIFIFSIFCGYFLNFMVEPILEGVPYMFLTFCFFHGMMQKFLKSSGQDMSPHLHNERSNNEEKS